MVLGIETGIDTAETTQAAPYFIFKNFSRIFLFWLPSDLQAGPALNIPRLGYDTLYLASGCYADHIASVRAEIPPPSEPGKKYLDFFGETFENLSGRGRAQLKAGLHG